MKKYAVYFEGGYAESEEFYLFDSKLEQLEAYRERLRRLEQGEKLYLMTVERLATVEIKEEI
jgi:hypothetical protein